MIKQRKTLPAIRSTRGSQCRNEHILFCTAAPSETIAHCDACRSTSWTETLCVLELTLGSLGPSKTGIGRFPRACSSSGIAGCWLTKAHRVWNMWIWRVRQRTLGSSGRWKILRTLDVCPGNTAAHLDIYAYFDKLLY